MMAMGLVLTFLTIHHIHKGQLLWRSMGLLSEALCSYIRIHGRMPDGMEELERSGILSRSSKGEWVSSYRGDVLYFVEDIVVNWSFRLEDVALENGELIDLKTRTPTFIIKANWPLSSDEGSMRSSIRLYDVLRGAVSTGEQVKSGKERG